MNIKNLVKRVTKEAEPDRFGDTCVSILRESEMSAFMGLRRTTLLELGQLHSILCRGIPNDFNFQIDIEEGEIDGQLLYEDGVASMGGVSFPVPVDDKLASGLKRVNWDSFRSMFLKNTNLQDDAAALAQTLEGGGFPCTAGAQEDHAKAYSKFLEEVVPTKPKFAVLAYGEDYEPGLYPLEFPNSRKDLLGEISDFLALHFPIIAIVDEGKLLTSDESEQLKELVFDGLGPISKAKAMGTFGAAMNIMTQ